MDFPQVAFVVLFLMWCATVAVACGVVRTVWLRELRAAAGHNEQLTRELGRLHEFYRTALERIGTTLQTGRPEVPEAIVTHEDDAEMRVRAQVSQETIERGIAQLRRAYESANIKPPSDAELREEALMLSVGVSPSPAFR